METKTSLHLIHPTLQFEAKHALRFLDNLLKTRTTAVSCGSDLFGAIPVFATGRDLKDDFATLQGAIGDYDFKWTKDTLDCSCDSGRHAIRRGTFEVDFGDAPCDFLGELWECPQPEVRACVRAAVSRLAKAVADLKPTPDGGVGTRFAALVRRYRLDARERNLLLAGLCDAHELLEYGLDERRVLPQLPRARGGERLQIHRLPLHLHRSVWLSHRRCREDRRVGGEEVFISRGGAETRRR